MTEAYTTLRARAETVLKVRGSRFVARAEPVNRREDALASVRAVRERLFDATHHCFAFALGPGREEVRMHDGGEPSGSAGRPILAAIERSGLTNLVVVVTRYFGGTKLGIAGLGRAYGDAADAVLKVGERRGVVPTETLKVRFPAEMTGVVRHLISTFGGHVTGAEYGDSCALTLNVPAAVSAAFCDALRERTSGRVRIGTGG